MVLSYQAWGGLLHLSSWRIQQLTQTEHLLNVRHCFMYFVGISSFIPYKNSEVRAFIISVLQRMKLN